jgi:hypothetical protein
MQLKYINNKGKEEIMNVSFWSFFKCNLLVQLASVGLVYTALFLFIIIILIIG